MCRRRPYTRVGTGLPPTTSSRAPISGKPSVDRSATRGAAGKRVLNQGFTVWRSDEATSVGRWGTVCRQRSAGRLGMPERANANRVRVLDQSENAPMMRRVGGLCGFIHWSAMKPYESFLIC